MSLQYKTKSGTTQESAVVDVADVWNGSYSSYPGRSDKQFWTDFFFQSGQRSIEICKGANQKSADAIVVIAVNDEGQNIKCGSLPALYYRR